MLTERGEKIDVLRNTTKAMRNDAIALNNRVRLIIRKRSDSNRAKGLRIRRSGKMFGRLWCFAFCSG